MSQLVDCYYLIDSRDKKIANNFLDDFFPERKETSEDYVVNSLVFTCADKLMEHLERVRYEEQTIYWKNINKLSLYKYAMIFYTNDNKIIIGISLKGKSTQEKKIEEIFLKLKEYLNTDICCITVEEMAPTNSIEFIKFCNNRYVPNRDKF